MLTGTRTMFAVPGWNVSAKSLVQEQAKPVKDKPTKGSAASTTVNQLTQPGLGNARKRKHTHDPDETSHERPKSQFKDKGINAHVDYGELGGAGQNLDLSKKKRSKAHAGKAESTEEVSTISAAPTNAKDANSQSDSSSKLKAKHEAKQSPTSVSQRLSSNHGTSDTANTPSLPPIPPAPKNLTPLQAKMRAKLTSARFRHLNETLYTTSSTDAMALFADSPDLFTEYHAGFSQQVKESWPQNPVDNYIKSIRSRGALPSPVNDLQPLPRRKPGQCKIVDLGCGDAPLARGLQNVAKKLSLTLYSYDLHAPNPHVTIADISALPLHDGEVDLAIFCLSLMGTNWLSFVEEAWRVLRGDGKGEVWVAEVKSRFGRISARKSAGKVVENSVGKRRKGPANKQSQSADSDVVEDRGFAETERSANADDDTDLQPFIDSFQRRGFMLRQGSVDRTNKMFVTMVFMKSGIPRAGKWKGMKWTGKEYQRIEDQRPGQHRNYRSGQRSGVDEEIDEQEEGKLLKPCVYKQR